MEAQRCYLKEDTQFVKVRDWAFIISRSLVPCAMPATWSMLKNFLMNATHLGGKGLSPMQ